MCVSLRVCICVCACLFMYVYILLLCGSWCCSWYACQQSDNTASSKTNSVSVSDATAESIAPGVSVGLEKIR